MKFKTLIFASLLLAVFSTVNAQETSWEIDKSHSSISFKVKHFKIATVRGSFDEFSGKIKSNDKDFTNADFDVVIKTASVNTNQQARDKHLRSADFFNAEVNTEIAFKSTSVTKKAEDTYAIKGDLTVNGITKPFEFTGEFQGSFVHPRFKTTIGVFNLSGTVPRLDFNVGKKFPASALSTDIEVSVNIEMKQTTEG
jgi:polyisoprenoid-binding protein YceI